jgi:hypothetical protein
LRQPTTAQWQETGHCRTLKRRFPRPFAPDNDTAPKNDRGIPEAGHKPVLRRQATCHEARWGCGHECVTAVHRETISLGQICPYCTSVHVIMFLLSGLLVYDATGSRATRSAPAGEAGWIRGRAPPSVLINDLQARPAAARRAQAARLAPRGGHIGAIWYVIPKVP